MSSKDCGNHGHKKRKIIKRLIRGILIFLFVVLLIVLLVWAILRPTKPRFVLQDATIYAFNVSSNPSLLTSNIEVTISSRNPNDRIGVYYDRLDIFATYRGQQITLPTRLPTSYQGHNEVTVWTPFVSGNSVPVAQYNALALGQDQGTGAILIMIKIDGRVRWKVGTFITGKYHIYVNCPATITFGNRNNGIVVGDAIKYQLVQRCDVSV